MPSLAWAGSFLLLTLFGSAVGCVELIGMPVLPEIRSSLIGLIAILAVWGVVLLTVTRNAKAGHEPLRNFLHADTTLV